MRTNARELEIGAELAADFCIIGSGPAGLAVALGLLAHGKSCVMLESGLDRFSPDHQSAGLLDSSFDFGNLQQRQLDERRQIGGKANAWSIQSGLGVQGIRLLPYNSANFAARPAMGDVSWPFDCAALDPYYAMASRMFEIPHQGWVYEQEDDVPFTGPLIEARRFRFSDGAILLRRITEEVIPSTRIRLIYNATAQSIGLRPDGQSAQEVRCQSEPGRNFVLKARQIVICCGALSTTAMLLRSDDVQRDGVGNQNGLVGRYFMDHPLVDGGQLFVSNPSLFDRAAAFDLRHGPDGHVMAHLQLREPIVRGEPLANMNAMLYPRARVRDLSAAHQNARRRTQEAFRTIKNPRRQLPEKVVSALTLAGGLGHVIENKQFIRDGYNARINRGGWSTEPGASARYKAFQVLHMCEQAPRYGNRVTLGEDRDRFGQRRVRIHWTWSDSDIDLVKRTQKIYAKAFRDDGWGEYQMLRDGDDPELVHSSLGHHIGTTRMHTDPKQGVTDSNAKVHGIANLYIASSALFPSGGWENPTLTIAALAFRLAEHLAHIM